MDKPWLSEPDKVSFIHCGLQCHILRITDGGGHLCGYVELPPESIWNDIENIRWDSPVEVHGGITFGISPLESIGDDKKYIGFDCAHAGDYCPNYERKYPGWHSYQGAYRNTYKDINYVQIETMRLADQVRCSIPQLATK